MPFASQVKKAWKALFTYEAAEPNQRRKSAGVTVKGEDKQLDALKRLRLSNSMEDLDRNLGLAQWMLDTYINYTARFIPHINTGNQAFDKKLVRVLERDSRAANFSTNGRFSMSDSLHLLQRSRLTFGDGAWLRVYGGTVQGIPGNRIDLPPGLTIDKSRVKELEEYRKVCNQHGFQIDPETGRILRFCLLRWNADGKLEFDHIEDAANVTYAPHVRTFDQTKGTTRLASIANQLIDLAEVHEYTRLKIKLHSTFGFMLSEDNPQGLPQREPLTQTIVETDDSGAVIGTTTTTEAKIDLNAAPWTLQAPEGAKLDLVESKIPSGEFIDYVQVSVRDALLSLGLPYTLYDGGGASFSARIADVNQLEYAIAPERERMRHVAEEWGDWKLDDHCSEGGILFQTMKTAGLTLDYVKYELEFVHTPAPWVDAKKQIEGDQLAASTCFDSVQRICARRGVNWRDIVDENAAVMDYARSKGVPLFLAGSGQQDAVSTADETAKGNKDQ